jgi:hypothetical protein
MSVTLELDALRLNHQSVFSVATDIAVNRWSSGQYISTECLKNIC